MAYADQQMSGSRVVAIIIVALIHIAVGYALVTGLAYNAAKKLIEHVTTVDINEPPPPPPDTPPPPEPDTPPPPVAPPPPLSIAVAPPPIQVTPNIPPPAPIVHIAAPAPPAPPPPRFTPKGAQPKGNPGSWQSADDYPSRALREEREGVTRFSTTISAEGRVTGCSVTGSSGSPDLDEAACRLVQRRGRFTPATDGEGKPTAGTWSSSVRWTIPK
jgi:protein TonB